MWHGKKHNNNEEMCKIWKGWIKSIMTKNTKKLIQKGLEPETEHAKTVGNNGLQHFFL
jgi:hypothetical protein